ncbi:MAG: PhpK family radical SAM P-methyltransferase [Tumebacillaceae bacterium]
MSTGNQLDCIVIGYNEPPFGDYEEMLRNYGEEAEAYRDLKFSFVNTGEQKLTYIGLMNHVYNLAHNRTSDARDTFISGEIPNLAAVYLTNSLRKKGHSCQYVNLFQYEKEKLIELLAQNPYMIALTTTFYLLNFPVTEMIEFIREHNSDVKIVVGGPLIANHQRNYDQDSFEFMLDDIGADVYVIESQGEQTLATLLEQLKTGGDLADVPNLAYFDDGELVVTLPQKENNSLDDHYIDWNLFAGEDLGPTLQTRTARSCAFKCSFCNYPTRAGDLTLSELDTIERELDAIKALGYVQNVVFIDDTFNIPLPRFKEVCRLMIRKNYNFNWFSYFRCGNADAESIELMAQAGCKGVFLGIESGAPSILKNMNKATTIEKYREGIKQLHEHGILTFGSFIMGFPGETEETVRETVDFVKETQMDYFRAQVWYCEKGTKIESQRETYKIEGEGFVWSHATMNSAQAMDQLENMYKTVTDSEWLPQWSFDFWIIPYVMGKGISLEQFKSFMHVANRLLGLHVGVTSTLSEEEQAQKREAYMANLVAQAKEWNVVETAQVVGMGLKRGLV